jgi:hypothetical protein
MGIIISARILRTAIPTDYHTASVQEHVLGTRKISKHLQISRKHYIDYLLSSYLLNVIRALERVTMTECQMGANDVVT